MLAIQSDPRAEQKRLILMARKAKWSTEEICRGLNISMRTLRAREAEMRQARQEAILAEALLELDGAAC